MARTAKKVATLASEDEEMTEALETVMDVAEEKGVVQWSDVSDDLTTGQWGRLIEKGLIVDADGDGFVVDDPESVREALDSDDPTTVGSDDDTGDVGSSWSKWDKLAALGALGMFAGYSMTSIRNAIGGAIDVVLGPVHEALPFYVVILILSVVTGLYSTLLQDNLMDMEVVAQGQERMQEIQERRKKAKERGDDEALDRIQEEQMEAMGDQMGMFKEQFRPMVWIMLLTIPVFLWMYWMILSQGVSSGGPVIVLPVVGKIQQWQQGIIGPVQAWIVWYFLCSMSFSQVIRKALNVQTSPSTS